MKYILPIIFYSVLLMGCSQSANEPLEAAPPPVALNETTATSTLAYDKLTAALLDKRLQIEVVREEGGKNPCEPQKPYYRLIVKRRGAEPYLKDPTGEDGGRIEVRETLEDIDIAQGIFLIEQTGEIEIMGKCLE